MNVGSPDAPTKPAVRRYLLQLLNDKRVIDLPWFPQRLVVNLLIIPLKLQKTTQRYLRLWTRNGSPLVHHTKKLQEKLQRELGEKADVFVGMRYGNPGYKQALLQIKKVGYKKILVLPLYPQYARPTSETDFAIVDRYLRKKKMRPEVLHIEQFYKEPGFIRAFAEKVRNHKPEEWDFVLFSYHGIPKRQDRKSSPENNPNDYSYSGACRETTQLLADELQLGNDKYGMAFLPRLTRTGIEPYTRDVLHQQLNEGKKRILVLAPSFVTDSLETLVEIEQDFDREFRQWGGEKLQLVESLNTSESWVKTLREMIEAKLG